MRLLYICIMSLMIFGQEIIPLAKGNVWTYEQRFFNLKGKLERVDTLVLTIPEIHTHDGNTFYEYRWDGADEADLLLNTEEGLYNGGRMTSDTIEFFEEPVLFLKYPIQMGDHFIDRINNIRYEYTHDNNMRQTPLGEFKAIRFLTYDINNNRPSSQEYTPGIGLVYVELLGQWSEIHLISYDLK